MFDPHVFSSRFYLPNHQLAPATTTPLVHTSLGFRHIQRVPRDGESPQRGKVRSEDLWICCVISLEKIAGYVWYKKTQDHQQTESRATESWLFGMIAKLPELLSLEDYHHVDFCMPKNMNICQDSRVFLVTCSTLTNGTNRDSRRK